MSLEDRTDSKAALESMTGQLMTFDDIKGPTDVLSKLQTIQLPITSGNLLASRQQETVNDEIKYIDYSEDISATERKDTKAATGSILMTTDEDGKDPM
ncbi:hypothetical protein SK128_027733 [Halocaridina rubra]|uniref:Uncharacterized protein n=1 Tax=Halocaridina rubra TaxID=373956 RepID=A0AAN8XDJ9_HALRR